MKRNLSYMAALAASASLVACIGTNHGNPFDRATPIDDVASIAPTQTNTTVQKTKEIKKEVVARTSSIAHIGSASWGGSNLEAALSATKAEDLFSTNSGILYVSSKTKPTKTLSDLTKTRQSGQPAILLRYHSTHKDDTVATQSRKAAAIFSTLETTYGSHASFLAAPYGTKDALLNLGDQPCFVVYGKATDEPRLTITANLETNERMQQTFDSLETYLRKALR